MTTLNDRISQDLTAAMKSRDPLRTDALRMARTALQNREIAKRAPLTEPEAEAVLAGLVKQREDAIELYDKGGRPELAQKERSEIEVLKGYLPQEASAEEIAAAVEQAVRETGAASVKDLGKAMKAAQALLKATGKPADGKRVVEEVRRKLGG